MGVRESIYRQVDKKSWVLEEEKGVWNSQGGGKDKCLFFFFFSLHSLVTQNVFSFKPWTDDYSPVHFSSVAQLCPTLCNPMNHSTPGLPVHHQLLEFTQTHIHRVSDAIQPSHSLSSPSPPAPNSSQRQSLFQWVNSSHQVAKVLEFQL